MKDMHPETYGTPNPDAPDELAQFAFLIGRWRGNGISRNEDGTPSPYRMTWVGRYILDGYAIADEARVLDDEGELEAVFVTHRLYDRARNRWIVEVFNALESKWFRQAAEDLGGVQVSDASITWMTRGPQVIGRESFLDRTEDHFTYRLDVSTDEGETWIEGVDVIEAVRMSPTG